MNNYNYKALSDAWSKSNIAVLDSMPGSGKTTAITNYLNGTNLNHVIFVSPFKSEVEDELPNNKLRDLNFTHPKDGNGGKVGQLHELIKTGDTSSGNRLHRITCTHAAFSSLGPEIYDQLGHYTIIIDETLDVIQPVAEVRKYTDYLLMQSGSINESKLYQFKDPSWFSDLLKHDKKQWSSTGIGHKDNMFRICQMASMNQLYRYDDSNWFRMLPVDLLSRAKHVIIMTHGFEYSFMHCWLKINGFMHSYIDNDSLGLVSESVLKSRLRDNLHFTNPPNTLVELEENRKGYEIFSMSHWEKLAKENKIEKISKSLNSIVKEKLKAKSDSIIWTCPKSMRSEIERNASRLKGRITLQAPLEIADSILKIDSESDNQSGKEHSSWLPCNIKARNDFRHINNCLYAFSLNPPPTVVNLLADNSSTNENDIISTFKLNNLLQFIFRGSIRENKPMNLCIIPHVTRNLLLEFLEHS